VLITGATGFIGVHLVDHLARGATAPLTVTFRSYASCATVSRFPVTYARLDLTNPGDLRALVRGQRYVFHLAVSRNPDTEQQVTVEGTRQLVEACIAEGVESVVILSTMYVMGHEQGVIDETAPYRPIGGSYGRAKAEMEQWVLTRARSARATRLTVLIPTCVYGPGGDTYTEGPVSFAREGRFAWIDGGQGIANVVYVTNLVDAMVLAATTPAAHGERFIVSDDSLTWRAFLTPLLGPWAGRVPAPDAAAFEQMCHVAETPTGVRDVVRAVVRSPDVWDAVTRTRIATRLRPLVKKYAPAVVRLRRQARPFAATPPTDAAAPVPPLWLREVFGPASARFKADKAAAQLGWTPSTPTSRALALTASWLEARGFFEQGE
jgi:nucleoside-diphosphate-sugar epimerase